MKYGNVSKIKYTVLKQQAIKKLGGFNLAEYFHGLDLQEMNDEIVDNELRKLFMTKKEK